MVNIDLHCFTSLPAFSNICLCEQSPNTFYYLRIDSKYCQYRVLKVENVNATLAFQTWQSYNFD